MAVAVGVALRIRRNLARMMSVAMTKRPPRASSSKRLGGLRIIALQLRPADHCDERSINRNIQLLLMLKQTL